MSESHRIVRLLKTNEVLVLISLAETGSLTLAADRLGITQSAVSRSLKAIEEEYGAEFFVRGRNGAWPTEELSRLLPQLRELYHAIQGASLALGAKSGRVHATMAIVGFRSAVTHILPPAIATVMKKHDAIRVSLATVREQGGGVQRVLEAGQADLGVTSVKPSRNLRSTFLGSDDYVLIRRRGERSRSPDRLVLWNERCSELVPTILSALRWNVAANIEVDTDTAVLGMILHGGGFTIMPELAADPLPPGLEKVSLPGDFRRGVWLCGSARVWESAAGRILIKHIRDAAKLRLDTLPR